MKNYKIELNEFEFLTITAATIFYCSYMKEKNFKMKKTEEVCKKLLEIKENNLNN